MPDLKAIGAAIAGRYAPGQVATPTNGLAIASSSSTPGKVMGQTPCVLVFVDNGSFEVGNGRRSGVMDWLVRLYYNAANASAWEIDAPVIQDYLTTMFGQHLTGLQLGGAVVAVRTMGFRMGLLTYAGMTYSGAELRVRTITSESWLPST